MSDKQRIEKLIQEIKCCNRQYRHNTDSQPGYVIGLDYDGVMRLLGEFKAEQAAGAEPVGIEYQHEDTGQIGYVDTQQVEWGFFENNPRLQEIGPIYRTPHPPKAVPDGLVEFAKVCLSASRNGCDMDGGEIQELALKLGLIEPYTVTKPCGSDCVCADVSDFPLTCYRDAGPLLSDQEG